ncbi:MAG TPA: NAD(P)-dependent oxidoreductase [Candidatus Limnocylindrales bacterium]|nr:NAD(P)-dependent oxidoreductase [Candidatus Limnocylindrales bacterium]
MRENVAVVGTGRMGGAIAKALHRGGFAPILYNRTFGRAVAVAAEIDSAWVVDTAGEAALAAEVVISMLADDDAVRSVYADLARAARPENVFVDMSTVMPATIREVAPAIRAAGARVLDAPVSGSTALAESGQLTLMVGGDAADLERARHVLEPLAKAIFHLGPLGSGAAMKLAVNAVIFGLNNAIAEGLVLAEAAGIERVIAYDVLAASAVGAPFVSYKRAAFLEPATTPVAFSLELAEKDLRLITSLADELGVSMPQAATNLALIRDAAATGGSSRDFSAVAIYLRAAQREGTPT